MGWFEEYFLQPIYGYEGYNIVNTTVYALIALGVLYAFYKLWKGKLGEEFFKGAVAFTLFGSAKRALTDAVDAGLIEGPLADLYAYNVWNVSPFIYIFVGALFLLTWWLEARLRKKGLTWKVGLTLGILHLLPLLPHIKAWWLVGASLLASALLYAAGLLAFRDPYRAAPVGAHALDGTASVLAIFLLSYGEQHVLANLLLSIHPLLFPAAKVAVAFIFSYYVGKEKDRNLYWILLTAATVIGLAPGIRNVLRASIGV